tara:strand:+ start:426 stop:1337 length:912 start_codon:yes stop_codon:yes gene_type:complete
MNSKILNPHLISALRPEQWTKNFLVFSAPLFSYSDNKLTWLYALVTFICFCFISSSVYLINDVLDIEADRNHHKKHKRAIASGLVSTKEAILLSIFLILIGFLVSLMVDIRVLIVLILYLLIQFSYCLHFKKLPLLDIFCIASGFLLRAIAGGLAGGLFISPWFLISVTLSALFLAIEKRKAELIWSNKTGKFNRRVLRFYSIDLLVKFENTVTSSSFIFYTLWASGPILNGAPTEWMLLTVPFVLLGIFRYQQISEPIENNSQQSYIIKTENPEEILLKDNFIKIIIIFWISTTFIIGYFFA